KITLEPTTAVRGLVALIWQVGGEFGLIFSRKSTGVRLLTTPCGSRSSMITWVVQKFTVSNPRLFHFTTPVGGPIWRLAGTEGLMPLSAVVARRQRSVSPSGSEAGT